MTFSERAEDALRERRNSHATASSPGKHSQPDDEDLELATSPVGNFSRRLPPFPLDGVSSAVLPTVYSLEANGEGSGRAPKDDSRRRSPGAGRETPFGEDARGQQEAGKKSLMSTKRLSRPNLLDYAKDDNAPDVPASPKNRVLSSIDTKWAQLVETRIRMQRSRLIIRHNSQFMQRWNMITVVLLLFTAFVTPYEVAFLTSGSPADPMFWVDRVVDVLFAIDVLINFNLEYLDKRSRMYVSKRNEIAKHYASGYLFFDVISIIPFEEIVRAAENDQSGAQILRITRIIRLVKLLRLLRSSRIFARMEEEMRINYGAMKLIKFVFFAVVVAHWMACLWHLTRELNNARCDWVSHYFGSVPDDGGCPQHDGVSKAERYVTALYLAAMTVSTVGYGDVPPQNIYERLYLVFATMIGGGIFAYVTGNVCQVVASMSVRETEFQTMMDSANRFIDEAYLSDELAERLRKYVRYKQSASNIKDWKRTLDELSPALRGEVAMELNATQLEKVPFFRVCSQEMLIELSFLLTHLTFPPMETIIRPGEPPDVMYVIKRGLVACVGRVLRRDNVVGEDMLFRSVPRAYSACTFTYVDLMALRKDQLEVILRGFSDTAVQLRRHVVKLLFRDQVHIFVRVVQRVALFAVEQRRRARREDRAERFPEWRDVLILLYYVRLVPEEVHQRMEFPLMLTVMRTVVPKMFLKIEAAIVRVQRRWRIHFRLRRPSSSLLGAFPSRHFGLSQRVLSGFLSTGLMRFDKGSDAANSAAVQSEGGSSGAGAGMSMRGERAPSGPSSRVSERWNRMARVSTQQQGGPRSPKGWAPGATGGSVGSGGPGEDAPVLLRSMSRRGTGTDLLEDGAELDDAAESAAQQQVQAAATAAVTAELLHQMQRLQSQVDRVSRQLDEMHSAREPGRLVRNLTVSSRGALGGAAGGAGLHSSVWSSTTASASRAPLHFDQVVAVHTSATNSNRARLGGGTGGSAHGAAGAYAGYSSASVAGSSNAGVRER